MSSASAAALLPRIGYDNSLSLRLSQAARLKIVSALEARRLTPARNAQPRWRNTWRQAGSCLGQGLAIVRRAPRLYLLISVVYAMPTLLAGYLAGYLREPALRQRALMLGLPWVTIVLGTVVIMVAVGYHSRGQPVDFGRVSGEAIRWVPRYVWTNVHTSLIFWAPIGLLVAARRWQAEALPTMWVPEVLVGGLWWLLITSLALYLHTRTLLAPFLAVHSDLPGTLAALEAWRLGGQHFLACFATLVLGTLPVAVPLVLLALGVAHNLPGPAQGAMLAAAPDLIWAGIQLVRPEARESKQLPATGRHAVPEPRPMPENSWYRMRRANPHARLMLA